MIDTIKILTGFKSCTGKYQARGQIQARACEGLYLYEFFARKILNCPAIFLRAPVFLFFSTFFLGYTFSRLYYLWDTTAVGRLYIERHHCIDISYISLVRLQFLYRFLVYLTSSLVSVDFFLRYGEIQYYGTSF